MLSIEIDHKNHIVMLIPDGRLSVQDFKNATDKIDAYIKTTDKLNGLLIHTEHFPGWQNFSSMTSHLRFINDHHKKIKKLALVSDSFLAPLAEILASHFVSAKIKNFDYKQLTEAKKWINKNEL